MDPMGWANSRRGCGTVGPHMVVVCGLVSDVSPRGANPDASGLAALTSGIDDLTQPGSPLGSALSPSQREPLCRDLHGSIPRGGTMKVRAAGARCRFRGDVEAFQARSGLHDARVGRCGSGVRKRVRHVRYTFGIESLSLRLKFIPKAM